MSLEEEDQKESAEKKAKKKEKNVIQTKVIVRRLPPGLNEAQFLEIVEPLPPNDFFRYVIGDRTLAPYNFARAYINFLNPDDIIAFRDKFDGLELERNNQKYPCVVEYAPFQKICKRVRKKEDSKANTIEQDADYLKFLESLEVEEEKDTLDVEKYLDELEAREKDGAGFVDTPLTSFIKQRREERKKLRDERRKLDIEKRKKKEEERRKRRELEKKKRLEAEKAKKKSEASFREENGKKTLAETRPNATKPSSKKSEEDGKDGKMKILQKDAAPFISKEPVIYSKTASEKKESTAKSDAKGDKPDKPSKTHHDKKWKGKESGDGKTSSPASQNKFSKDKEEVKSKQKSKDRTDRTNSPRGRGKPHSASGEGRPPKYSLQRSRGPSSKAKTTEESESKSEGKPDAEK